MNGSCSFNSSLVEPTSASRSDEMRAARAPATDQSVALARAVVDELFGPPCERTFAVRYWTGETEPGMAADGLLRSRARPHAVMLCK